MSRIVVAIPVKDEAALIGDCLRALALQQGSEKADILLLVNNSTDGTADIARALRPTLPCGLHILEHNFAPAQANAGNARRLAMSKAAMITDPGGFVLTTDADGCVAPDWLSLNVQAFRAGADVVCGRAVIDPVDALRIPGHLHEDDELEVQYATQLDRIACAVDPSHSDPWPRHTEELGASIAVRRDSFLAAGGVPAVRSGEDRALVDALRRIDARIRHEPDITVSVSGRTNGRAAGGMADTIRRRIQCQDATLDSALEPAANRIARVIARRLMRAAWSTTEDRGRHLDHLVRLLELPYVQLEGWLALPYFGAAWALAEAASPNLRHELVPRSNVERESSEARAFLASLAAEDLRTLQPDR